MLELLKSRQLLPGFDAAADLYCVIEDEALRPQTLKVVEELRWAGFVVEYSLTPSKPDKQFKRAQDLKAAQAIRLCRNEHGEVSVKIRALKTREETSATMVNLLEKLEPPSRS